MRLTRNSLIAAALFATFALTRYSPAPPPPVSFAGLPVMAGELRATHPSRSPLDTARTIGADEYLYRVYRGSDALIEMDVAYYRDPRVGHVMHSPLNCLPGNGWTTTPVATVSVAGRWPVRVIHASRGGKSLALMYWYQAPHAATARIAPGVTAGDIESRLLLVANGLRYGRRDSALVRLVTPTGPATSAAVARLVGLAGELIPQIAARMIPQSANVPSI